MPGVITALGAVGEAVGVNMKMTGKALSQPNPCSQCEEGTATKLCQNCQQELCEKCSMTKKHREHEVGGI